MITGVADTHTALWYVFDDKRLSRAAGSFIEQAEAEGSTIVVSVISLAEIVYLIEKGRLPANAYADLQSVLANPDHVFREAQLTIEIVDTMKQVRREEVPDLPDRIVAATALYFNVPVISRDNRIRAADLETVW